MAPGNYTTYPDVLDGELVILLAVMIYWQSNKLMQTLSLSTHLGFFLHDVPLGIVQRSDQRDFALVQLF